MRLTTTSISRALEAVWLVTMGLFLGLTCGMVLAVILTFRGTRAIDAAPGTLPFSDSRFAIRHSDAVAGYIGQDLFLIGGMVALGLLSLALIAHLSHGMVLLTRLSSIVGSVRCSRIRSILLMFCVLCMIKAASLNLEMNRAWPGLYDLSATDATLDTRRASFESLHAWSEKIVSAAWLSGLIALSISPWCRRIADAPVQSGDGKKENG